MHRDRSSTNYPLYRTRGTNTQSQTKLTCWCCKVDPSCWYYCHVEQAQHSGSKGRRRSEARTYKQYSKIDRDKKAAIRCGLPANGHRVCLRQGKLYDYMMIVALPRVVKYTKHYSLGALFFWILVVDLFCCYGGGGGTHLACWPWTHNLLLLRPPKCWDYRCRMGCSAALCKLVESKQRVSYMPRKVSLLTGLCPHPSILFWESY